MIVMSDVQCCGGTGWYKKNVPFGHPDFGKLFRCECGRAGDPEARKSALNASLKAYAGCTFETWNPARPINQPIEWGGVTYSEQDQVKAMNIATKRAKAYAQTPDGMLFIFGGFGAGKTHLAAAIGHECAERNVRVVYRNIPALFDELRQASGDFAVDNVMRALLDAELLILDDIGAEEARTSFIQGRLFRLLDERIHLPTVITSNVDLTSLEELIGGRTASRLHLAKTIWLPVSDYRKRGR